MTNASDRLIESLVRNLEPVRPLPRLRSAYALILALWATLLGIVLMTQAGEPGVRSLFTNVVYTGCFVGLGIASLGATASALASGVPGRDRLEVGGMAVCFVGLLLGGIACWASLHEARFAATPSPEGLDGMCFRSGALFALLPGGAILAFLVRGWSAHPVRAAMVALLAAGSLGAWVVQVSCGFVSARHLLIGHLGVPIVFALLGIVPLAVLLRRLRR